MLLFLISSGVGVWAAYNQQAAWSKFWLLIGAVFLFYALAGQPRKNLWPIIGFLGFSGLFVGGYFLLTHDWGLLPAKIDFFNRMLLRWMELRPAVDLKPLPANVAASLMAISTPLLVAWGAHAFFRNSKDKLALAAIVAALVVVVLFLSTSRGAWLGLALALTIGLLVILSRLIARRSRYTPGLVLAVLFLTVSIIVGILIVIFPGGATTLIGSVQSAPGTTDRYSLYISTINLIRDFPITGSGLASFAGLYSHYFLGIPFFFLPNGHNVFLDVTLEQGPLGLIAFVMIFLGSFALLARGSEHDKGLLSEVSRSQLVLRLGIAASMIIMLVHGFLEDTVYYSQFALFLFALPGLTAATILPNVQTEPVNYLQGKWVALATLSLLLLAVGFFLPQTSRPSQHGRQTLAPYKWRGPSWLIGQPTSGMKGVMRPHWIRLESC
jgi:O-antigen ligase